MGGAVSTTTSETTPLDHTSMATLRAVTDATQTLISRGPTFWKDVEILLEKYSKIDTVCRSNFPGSMVLSAVAEVVNNELEKLDYHPGNTLFAASVCPDEINHMENNSLVNILSKQWGQCFQMGGLAGIPFPGQTGFGAFATHVPNNGNLFILFAPHVGISDEGVFGKYNRSGQEGITCTACGAAIGAYNHVLQGGEVPDFTHLGQFPFDYQQQWIISKLAPCMNRIQEASSHCDPMVSLAHEIYLIIKDFIEHIIINDSKRTKYKNVILLGGIHINTPIPMEDFFLPLLFEVRSPTATTDLLGKMRHNIQLATEDVDAQTPLPIEPEIISETNSNTVHTFIRAMSLANHDHLPHLVTEY